MVKFRLIFTQGGGGGGAGGCGYWLMSPAGLISAVLERVSRWR